MKNMDFKKLIVLLVVIAVVILTILGLVKIIQKVSGPNKETEEKIEELIKNYYSNITFGYSTIYNGVDIIYDTNKATVKDINPGTIIELAIKYANNNDKDLAVDDYVNEYFTKSTKREGIAYNAKTIQECAKALFNIDLELKDYLAEANYLYDYYYIADYDAFVKVASSTSNLINTNAAIDLYVIESRIEKDTVVTKVAVGYVYYNGASYKYSKDKNGTTVLASDLKEMKFPKEKVDEFKQYEFTTKKVNGNYIFENVKKVEK